VHPFNNYEQKMLNFHCGIFFIKITCYPVALELLCCTAFVIEFFPRAPVQQLWTKNAKFSLWKFLYKNHLLCQADGAWLPMCHYYRRLVRYIWYRPVRLIPFIRYEKCGLFSIGCCQSISINVLTGRYPRYYWYQLA
jgi:hypothetical protein